MAKYLDNDGVLYLWNKIKSRFVEQASGKGLSSNDFTDTEKTKLAGLQNYTHPTFTARTNGLYKITVNNNGHVIDVTEVTKQDIEALGVTGVNTTYTLTKVGNKIILTGTDGSKLEVEDSDTTYDVATASTNGLMSAADKTKLNAFGAASTYALKTDITGVYKFKGSVTNESNLPTNAAVGDVYNIVNASVFGGPGMNVVWTGTAWDALGEMFTIDAITNSDLDSICV